MRIHNELLRSILILSLIGLVILPSGAMESGNPALYNAYNGLDKLGVEDAWDMGYTGEGVKVAVMDSGVDFATPDLIGTQARVTNASSPYYGWPLVIDIDYSSPLHSRLGELPCPKPICRYYVHPNVKRAIK